MGMVVSKIKQILTIALLAGVGSAVLVTVWLASMFLLATHGSQIPAKVIFNVMMQIVTVLVLLPLVHIGLYRTFWRNEDRFAKGLPAIRGTYLDGNQPMPAPAPATHYTFGQKLLYVECYVFGIAVLLWIFIPLEHAAILSRFIARHSSGSATAGSLYEFLFAYLPMVVLLMPLMWLLNGERKAIIGGRYPAEETLRRKLKQNWLFSFAGALVSTGILCQFVSGAVLAFL